MLILAITDLDSFIEQFLTPPSPPYGWNLLLARLTPFPRYFFAWNLRLLQVLAVAE